MQIFSKTLMSQLHRTRYLIFVLKLCDFSSRVFFLYIDVDTATYTYLMAQDRKHKDTTET